MGHTGEMTSEQDSYVGGECVQEEKETSLKGSQFTSLGMGAGWDQHCPHIFLRWLLLPTPKSHLSISHLLQGHWGSRSLGGRG